ncbi:ATPase family AAA domain-containing protein 5b [Scomber scombrus]|uniref:ATPase family AAA domain-containing protein 5b n=1 Tax=Scomber scombrus TaxID=13677 RepID=UPI002DD9DF9B|nr:ATPase family AAA domain-containing protein 5b [Scomber scombrus]
MRNKLKLSKISKDASCTSKNPLRATEVITLSDDETSPVAKDKCSNVAEGSISSCKAQPLQEKKGGCYAKDINIAPIFLRITQQGKGKRSSDGGFDQPEEELQKSMLLPQSDEQKPVKSRLSSPAGFHLTERKRSWKWQLSSSALLGCLEEIQTSNLAFPVQRVFGSLQEKNVGSLDSSFEDELWTDKYSPQRSSEVIGNSASVNKLHSWLKKWKLRADFDERRKKEERKQEENSSDSWDCGDFQGEVGTEGESLEPPCNTMLITGPSGGGKTASVYACAQELGFKVFEVNCSSQRSGRHVLSQLKEATQSHLLETSGKDLLKPAYFNNYNTKSCSQTGKSVAPKNVISSSKKRPAQNRKGKANPATVTLANFFKMKAKADHLHFGGLLPSENPDRKKPDSSSQGSDQTALQNKKKATSLILFEEVDVIFEGDVGFLPAIKTFMTTTKRPVILTTNDPSFRERFCCSLEEIIFKTPSAMNVCSYLQLVCLAENAKLELDDVISLLTLTRGDVRRCLLQLQLWVNSGGGRTSQRGDSLDSQLNRRDAGCSASMLGLHSVTQNHLLNLLKVIIDRVITSWTDSDMNKLLQLLAESWRRNIPLLYSNQELFLPIRAKGAPVQYLDKVTSSGQQSELAPSDIQLNGNVDSMATAAKSNSVRSVSRLSRRKYTSAAFNATSSSNLTEKPQTTSLTFHATHFRALSSDDRTELNAAKVTTDCLDALTDFFDLMSYLDATIPSAEPLISDPCRPEFVWTGAEMKDSLLDEMREGEQEGRCCRQDMLLDIQAAVEGLGFRRCWRRASESWTEAHRCIQKLGGTRWGRLMETPKLPVSVNKKSLSYSFQPLCAPSVSQSRYELSRTVLGSQSFSLLGNRQAVTVDYMPVLRSICRSQRPQQQREEPVRCLNYLSSKHLGLPRSTLQCLAEDFS